MALRKIVNIDEDLCDGCGDCVPSCAEGAIRIIDGKARLVGDMLCDGLGACLGDCPRGAITIVERDAAAFDEDAVEKHLAGLGRSHDPAHGGPAPDFQPAPAPLSVLPGSTRAPSPQQAGGGCPGSRPLQFGDPAPAAAGSPGAPISGHSQLRQWPVQLHLISPKAPYYQEADVLLAADCCAFAVGDFHDRFLKGKALAVACPKLDSDLDVYVAKLAAMIDLSRINTLTVLMMQVPCCSGLLRLAREAVMDAERKVPVKQIIVGVQGEVLKEEWV
ncbi:4Fe-4S ferredoxin [bacterium]|nr:4Fe-4S ferredoxin [bacterium]